MSFSPTSRSNRGAYSTRRGFTLIEVMTAITVFSIMLLMLGQIVSLVGQAWMKGQRNVNNFTKSRAMLDLFAADIQAGVFRGDLPSFPSPSANIEFYTKRPGIPGSTAADLRNVSLIQYAYSTDLSSSTAMTTLQRGDMAILWSSAPTAMSFKSTASPVYGSNTTTSRDMAPGVVDYKVRFIYADGSSSTSYPHTSGSPLRALSLTLAVLDDITLQQVSKTQVQALRTALDGAATGNRSVKADWEAYLDSTAMNWSNYPKALGSNLKIFERYVQVIGF